MRLNPFRAVRPGPSWPPGSRRCRTTWSTAPRRPRWRGATRTASCTSAARTSICPSDVDPYDPADLRPGARGARRFHGRGTLLREREPALYLYRQVMDGRAQTGVVGCVHIDDYEHDVIRKHEKTRPDKEDDRTRHVLTLNANAEPVFLTYRGPAEIDRLVAPIARRRAPLYDFTAPDGVRHTVWRVPDPGPVRRRVRRGAAAPTWPTATTARPARGAPARSCGRQTRAAPGDGEYNWFLAVLFPADAAPDPAVQPRGARSERARRRRELLARLSRRRPGQPSPSDPVPPRPGSFCFYLAGRWYRLELDEATIDRQRSDRLARRVAAAGSGAGPDPRHRRSAHRQADRLRGRHPGHGGAGAAGATRARWRWRSRCIRRRWSSSWRCRRGRRSCRPRAPGSSPSCGAGCSCIP